MFTYSIDENNTVWGYTTEQPEPFLKQPQHPNGTAWVDAADAAAWAELWILHMTDPDNNVFPL